MKVWAEHQKTQGALVIKCPMCREDFGSLTALQQVCGAHRLNLMPFQHVVKGIHLCCLFVQEHRNSSLRDVRAHISGEHLGTSCYKCDMCPIVGKCYR